MVSYAFLKSKKIEHVMSFLSYFYKKISPDIIKHWHHSLSCSKIDFEGLFGGFLGWWHPQTMPKYLFVKYLLISKQTGTKVELFKKLIFGGPFRGVPVGGGTPKLCQNICLLNFC